MTAREMRGRIQVPEERGEYTGVVEPTDEMALFEGYHYKTYYGPFSAEMYVRDMRNDTFTSRDVSLASMEAVVKRELDIHTKQHAIRSQQRAQENSLYRTPGGATIPAHDRRLRATRKQRRRPRHQ